MKKILTLILFVSSLCAYSQGIIHIYNFSPYSMSFNLYANNPTATAGNCTPNIDRWGVPPQLLPGNDVTYLNFNDALLSPVAPVSIWRNYDSGINYPAPGPHAVLNIYSLATKWQGSKFEVRDPVTGAGIPNGNFSQIGGLGCGTSTTFIASVGGTGYPIFADWFMIGNETYFIVQ